MLQLDEFGQYLSKRRSYNFWKPVSVTVHVGYSELQLEGLGTGSTKM